MGTLYLVSTPIGNLEDLSPRAARILSSVQLILAEDTRRTRRLVDHIGASTRMMSLHSHNEEARIAQVLTRLGEGGELALVSDAGTPLVSDPGERLVRKAVDAGHSIVPVPGPSAVLAALVGSGFPTIPFTFLGFVARKGRERAEALERIVSARETIVAFESPERLARLLADLAERADPDRHAAVAREMTKVHEEFRRGTLGSLARYYAVGRTEGRDTEAGDSAVRESSVDESSTASDAGGDTEFGGTPRGEVTVVVAPVSDDSFEGRIDHAAGTALAHALLEEGVSPSRAAREIADRLGISRNRAYDLVQKVAAEGDRDD